MIFRNFQKISHIAKNIWHMITASSLHLSVKIYSEICPWTFSIPQSSQFSSNFASFLQFSSSFAQNTLLTLENRLCPQTNIGAHFRTKRWLYKHYPWEFTTGELNCEDSNQRKKLMMVINDWYHQLYIILVKIHEIKSIKSIC